MECIEPIGIRNDQASFHVRLSVPWQPTPEEMEELPFPVTATRAGTIEGGPGEDWVWVEFDVERARFPMAGASLKGVLCTWLIRRVEKLAREARHRAALLDEDPCRDDAAKAVSELRKLALLERTLGLVVAKECLADMVRFWTDELHSSVVDIDSLVSYCPTDRRHFELQKTRVRQRAELIAEVSGFLRRLDAPEAGPGSCGSRLHAGERPHTEAMFAQPIGC